MRKTKTECPTGERGKDTRTLSPRYSSLGSPLRHSSIRFLLSVSSLSALLLLSVLPIDSSSSIERGFVGSMFIFEKSYPSKRSLNRLSLVPGELRCCFGGSGVSFLLCRVGRRVLGSCGTSSQSSMTGFLFFTCAGFGGTSSQSSSLIASSFLGLSSQSSGNVVGSG